MLNPKEQFIQETSEQLCGNALAIQQHKEQTFEINKENRQKHHLIDTKSIGIV